MDYFISVEDIKTELEEEVEIPVPSWMQVDNGEKDPLALNNVKIEEFGGSEELHFSQDLKPGVEPKVEDELKTSSTVLYGCPMTSEEGIHFKKPVLLESVATVKEEKPFCSYTSEINPKLEAYTEKFDIKSKNIILELVAEMKKEQPSCSYASNVKSELEAHTEDIGREQDIDLTECEIPSASIQHCHQLEVRKIRSREVEPKSITQGCINTKTSDETSSVFKQITYKCKICNYLFVYEKLYKRQLLKQVDDNLFSCDQCDFKTLYKKILNDHMTKHTGDKTFRCKICRYICCRCNYKRFSCNVCHFKSSTSYGLRCHNEKMHINDKTFICKLCQFKFFTACSLKWHIWKKHKKSVKPVKPSTCNLYQYKCSKSGSLKKHKII